MENSRSARRLAKEVDALMCEAFDGGVGSQVTVRLPGKAEKLFTVDRITASHTRDCCEIWMSAEAGRSLWDWLCGIRRRHLLRVTRQQSEIRQTVGTLVITTMPRGVRAVEFSEYVAAPRQSPSVTRHSTPRRDSIVWMRSYTATARSIAG